MSTTSFGNDDWWFMAVPLAELDGMSVDDVLRRWPDTAVVFRRYGLACLGCAVASFCEVTAVASIYNLPPDPFMADLQAAIEKQIQGTA